MNLRAVHLDSERFERDLNETYPIPRTDHGIIPRGPDTPATMTDQAKLHMTALHERVGAWLEQRASLSDELTEAIETADNIRRICMALQSDLDSAHVVAIAEPQADAKP